MDENNFSILSSGKYQIISNLEDCNGATIFMYVCNIRFTNELKIFKEYFKDIKLYYALLKFYSTKTLKTLLLYIVSLRFLNIYFQICTKLPYNNIIRLKYVTNVYSAALNKEETNLKTLFIFINLKEFYGDILISVNLKTLKTLF